MRGLHVVLRVERWAALLAVRLLHDDIPASCARHTRKKTPRDGVWQLRKLSICRIQQMMLYMDLFPVLTYVYDSVILPAVDHDG